MSLLPFDSWRCTGFTAATPSAPACASRESCQRYIAYLQLKDDAALAGRGLPVGSGSPDCRSMLPATRT
ncbi:hypothetical protein [Geopseudomonas aromaticivorans]